MTRTADLRKALVWVRGAIVLVNSGRSVVGIMSWARAFYRLSTKAVPYLGKFENGRECDLDYTLHLGDLLIIYDPDLPSDKSPWKTEQSVFVGCGSQVVEIDISWNTNLTVCQLRQFAREQGLEIPESAIPTIQGEEADPDSVPGGCIFILFLETDQLHQPPSSREQPRLPNLRLRPSSKN